jgi:hypothetical protein
MSSPKPRTLDFRPCPNNELPLWQINNPPTNKTRPRTLEVRVQARPGTDFTFRMTIHERDAIGLDMHAKEGEAGLWLMGGLFNQTICKSVWNELNELQQAQRKCPEYRVRLGRVRALYVSF